MRKKCAYYQRINLESKIDWLSSAAFNNVQLKLLDKVVIRSVIKELSSEKTQ